MMNDMSNDTQTSGQTGVAGETMMTAASAIIVAALQNGMPASEIGSAMDTVLARFGGNTQPVTEHVAEAAPEAEPTEYVPAVSVRKSLASPDQIISMIDGKGYKTLKRHLSTHGMTPEQYRERYNLKADYPMVAPSYAESRRNLAKKIGLGRKPGQRVNATGGQPTGAKRGRKAQAQPETAEA